MTIQTLAVIPARYASTRLPGKPMLPIAGVPLILRVLRGLRQCGGIDRTIVATDDERIASLVESDGGEAMMTPSDLPSGGDRVAWAAERIPSEFVLNVQGDDPLVGLYRSHDAFYMESKAAHPGLRERMQKWIDTGVLVVENESGTLFTYGHLLGLRTASICVALGSMFADPNEQVYGAYADPDFLAGRIELASRIALRAAELLKEAGV